MNYRVSFFSVEHENVKNPDGVKQTLMSYKHIGHIVIDDEGVDNKNLTLMSKAYRHAPENLLRCSRVKIEKI